VKIILYTNKTIMLLFCVKLDGVRYITCQFEGRYLLQNPAAVILDHYKRHVVLYFVFNFYSGIPHLKLFVLMTVSQLFY